MVFLGLVCKTMKIPRPIIITKKTSLLKLRQVNLERMENKKDNLLYPVPILATSACADYGVQKLSIAKYLFFCYTTKFYTYAS